jgi:hypothetical protein
MLDRIVKSVRAISTGGVMAAGSLAFAMMCNRFTGLGSILLFTKFSRHPLLCRLRTSDAMSFRQIFISREYAPFDDTQNVGLIVDCGAYVGYSSAYFLSAFQNSHVVAIEPDPGNFRF